MRSLRVLFLLIWIISSTLFLASCAGGPNSGGEQDQPKQETYEEYLKKREKKHKKALRQLERQRKGNVSRSDIERIEGKQNRETGETDRREEKKTHSRNSRSERVSDQQQEEHSEQETTDKQEDSDQQRAGRDKNRKSSVRESTSPPEKRIPVRVIYEDLSSGLLYVSPASDDAIREKQYHLWGQDYRIARVKILEVLSDRIRCNVLEMYEKRTTLPNQLDLVPIRKQ